MQFSSILKIYVYLALISCSLDFIFPGHVVTDKETIFYGSYTLGMTLACIALFFVFIAYLLAANFRNLLSVSCEIFCKLRIAISLAIALTIVATCGFWFLVAITTRVSFDNNSLEFSSFLKHQEIQWSEIRSYSMSPRNIRVGPPIHCPTLKVIHNDDTESRIQLCFVRDLASLRNSMDSYLHI